MTTVQDILSFLKSEKLTYRYSGVENLSVEGFSSLGHYCKGTVTWAKTTKAYEDCQCQDSIALLIAQDGIKAEGNVIYCAESKQAFFSVLDRFLGRRRRNRCLARVLHNRNWGADWRERTYWICKQRI